MYLLHDDGAIALSMDLRRLKSCVDACVALDDGRLLATTINQTTSVTTTVAARRSTPVLMTVAGDAAVAFDDSRSLANNNHG
jgi:hypothetical protein